MIKYKLTSKRKGLADYEHSLDEGNGNFAKILKEVRIGGYMINEYIQLNESQLVARPSLERVTVEFELSE